ncbi:hypothetical protein D3C76_793720 [compost metagenome]
MFELGQLHLQLALVGTGALGEDVQDQPGAVQNTAFERALQVTLLAGREGVIEDDQLDLLGADQVVEFLDLAAADQVLG